MSDSRVVPESWLAGGMLVRGVEHGRDGYSPFAFRADHPPHVGDLIRFSDDMTGQGPARFRVLSRTWQLGDILQVEHLELEVERL